MDKKVDVVIIGAGSAGLSALRQIKKNTDNYLIIDHGPLGTKCARIGCMPSKALINVAKDFHRREVFAKEGILGADNLSVDIPLILEHVRQLRDYFSNEMVKTTRKLAGNNLVIGHAEILTENKVRAGEMEIKTDKIIIATGSRPVMPGPWKQFASRIFTSDDIFEAKDLPNKMAVIGLGAIGLELGQALSRLGIEITGFTTKPSVADIAAAEISRQALKIFKKEFPIYTDAFASLEQKDDKLLIKHPETELTVDAALVAVGVEPNIEGLGLENLGLKLDKRPLPFFNYRTSKINDMPIFIAGDVNGARPILHEALDEGFIAGRNSGADTADCYCRRTPFTLVFSDPQIAAVGLNSRELVEKEIDFVTGKADFTEQSRSIVESKNKGLMYIYAEKVSAKIIGAELLCPEAEHLSHELAIAIGNDLTVFDMLNMPFYHPTVEEALRTALKDAAQNFPDKSQLEGLTLCESTTEAPLS